MNLKRHWRLGYARVPARRLAGRNGSRNWISAVIALPNPKVVRACVRGRPAGWLADFSLEDRVPPLLDSNKGSLILILSRDWFDPIIHQGNSLLISIAASSSGPKSGDVIKFLISGI